MRLDALIAETRSTLSGTPEAALEARLLVEHFTATSRTDAIAHPERLMDNDAVAAVRAAAARRRAGEPVHRIIGFRAFRGLVLHLSPDTLEPRPDTEILVEALLPHARSIEARKGRCRILDLGTGTGAIALALLSELPGATALGLDISSGALETAWRNAEVNGVSQRFETLGSNWFDKVEAQFDIIVSNPPYIERAIIAGLAPEVRDHDPVLALDGGEDGLDAYRIIASGSRNHLEPDGIAAVEIGMGQGPQVVEIYERTGYRLIESADDLAGHQRALVFDTRRN